MKVIKCNVCGNDVNSKEKYCPHCTSKLIKDYGISNTYNQNNLFKQKNEKNFKVFRMFLVIIIMIFIIMGFNIVENFYLEDNSIWYKIGYYGGFLAINFFIGILPIYLIIKILRKMRNYK